LEKISTTNLLEHFKHNFSEEFKRKIAYKLGLKMIKMKKFFFLVLLPLMLFISETIRPKFNLSEKIHAGKLIKNQTGIKNKHKEKQIIKTGGKINAASIT
jgi:hypothetical protein